MPLSVQSLGSGSSGNALLLDDGSACVLVDCGIGPRQLAKALAATNRSPSDIEAVLVTHEHIDHVRGLKALGRTDSRLVASEGTATAASLPTASWEEIRLGSTLRVGRLTVTALAVSHDAKEPCGYHIASDSGGKVVVITDIGCRDDALIDPLSEADLIVLEANHDLQMLRNGPYPHYFKRRVLSSSGHLSNSDCGVLLADEPAASSHSRRGLARPPVTDQQSTTAGGGNRSPDPLPMPRVATSVIALPRQAVGPRGQRRAHPPATRRRSRCRCLVSSDCRRSGTTSA